MRSEVRHAVCMGQSTGTYSNPQRVAVVVSAINMRRLLPGMRSFVESGQDFWLVDIYRPIAELRALMDTWRPAGLITEWLPEITEPIMELGYPTVLATSDMRRPGVASIDVDDFAIGAEVADYFLRRGFEHFAFIGNQTPYSVQRQAGFAETLKAEGHACASLDVLQRGPRQYIEHWHESDTEVVDWLQALPRPVGIFAAHDPLGRLLAETCRDARIRVPEDVAIVGVNDDELVCLMTNPPLSSVSVPWSRVGFECAKRMNEMARSPRRKHWDPVLVPPGTVVTRASSDRLAVDDPRLAAAMRYIREHACSGIQVKDVVARVRMNRRTLEQAFRKHLGRSPREEIIRIRIERAKKLLSQTDTDMPTVAERCGFSNAEIFSVNFRKAMGRTPMRFRRSFRLR